MASIRSDSELVAQAGEGLRLALGPCAPFAVSSKRGWEDLEEAIEASSRIAKLLEDERAAESTRIRRGPPGR